MKLVLIVLNESSKELGHLDLDGVSGLNYKFIWNDELKAFAYTPKNQEELDDIFGTAALPRFPWRFRPIITDGEMAGGTGRCPPWIPRKRYAENELSDLLLLCADCGFTPASAGDRDAVLAQLDAYMLGRGVCEALSKTPTKAGPKKPPPLRKAEPVPALVEV